MLRYTIFFFLFENLNTIYIQQKIFYFPSFFEYSDNTMKIHFEISLPRNTNDTKIFTETELWLKKKIGHCAAKPHCEMSEFDVFLFDENENLLEHKNWTTLQLKNNSNWFSINLKCYLKEHLKLKLKINQEKNIIDYIFPMVNHLDENLSPFPILGHVIDLKNRNITKVNYPTLKIFLFKIY